MKPIDLMKLGCRVMLFLLPVLLSACAEIRVNTLPPPPPTAKLRVCVLPLSAALPNSHWRTPHEEFVKKQTKRVSNILKESGIYQIVSDKEVAAAVGSQSLGRWQMERNGGELARRIGAAVHADYVLIGERGPFGSDFYWEVVLVNVETGKEFGVFFPVKRQANVKDKNKVWGEAMNASYREIFKDAKEDLLATALKKSLLLAPAQERRTAEGSPAKEKTEQERLAEGQAAREKAEQERRVAEQYAREEAEQKKIALERVTREEGERRRQAEEKARQDREASERAELDAVEESQPAAEEAEREGTAEAPQTLPTEVEEKLASRSRRVDLTELAKEEVRRAGLPRLVVYDLEAVRSFETVALILSEALREEIYKLGQFNIVNRENLVDIMKESKFQQSGLVDETQVVRLGKGLAASQVVTGRISPIGKSSVMQAKRIDVETLGTLAVQSLKCKQGEEEVLLEKMHDLAKGLAGGK
jgi:Curli production assembly/transport component CsgG